MSQVLRSRSHGLGAELVLSVFPGIDLFGQAFEEAGFCVVRGPDLITGGDVRDFHPPAGKFSGVIGGPPCQDFSGLNRTPDSYGHDMLKEYCRVVTEAGPDWFLFENVDRVPEFEITGYTQQRFSLDLAWFSDFSRLRVFVFGARSGQLLNPVKGTKGETSGGCVTGKDDRSFPACCEIQGLPPDFNIPFFTLEGKKQAVANAVPLPLSRYVAGLIVETIYGQDAISSDPAQALNRRCKCGCGRIVIGRASYHSAACRKRAQRSRDKCA